MVEAYGTSDYKYNAIDESQYSGAPSYDMHASGKERRGGVGGKGSKSTNFKECKNANIRRNQKKQREEDKRSAAAK